MVACGGSDESTDTDPPDSAGGPQLSALPGVG